jgi:hypothetical protein
MFAHYSVDSFRIAEFLSAIALSAALRFICSPQKVDFPPAKTWVKIDVSHQIYSILQVPPS